MNGGQVGQIHVFTLLVFGVEMEFMVIQSARNDKLQPFSKGQEATGLSLCQCRGLYHCFLYIFTWVVSIPPIGHFRLHLIRMFSTCKRELVVFHSLSRLGVVSRSWFSLCMSNISLGPFQHGYALLFISLQGGTLLFISLACQASFTLYHILYLVCM